METGHLAHIVAVLSCNPGRSASGAAHVFELIVGLAPGAHLDLTLAAQEPYRARRLVNGQQAWSGRLVLQGVTWALHSDDDDDPIWFITFDRLRPGEYLTLHRPGETVLEFRIVNVSYSGDSGGFHGADARDDSDPHPPVPHGHNRS